MTEMPNPSDRRPRAIDRILSSRGVVPGQDMPERANSAFVDSGGTPQMSFSVERASGEVDGFHYFNLDNIKFTPTKSGDHISFDHRGKVVVIAGQNLRPVFTALMRHTLIAIIEASAPVKTDYGTNVTRVDITRV